MVNVIDGLVHFAADGGTETIQQAALVQLYAVLAWPWSRLPLLYRARRAGPRGRGPATLRP